MNEGITPIPADAMRLHIQSERTESSQIWRIEGTDMSPDFNPGDMIEVSFHERDLASVRAGDPVVICTPSGTQMLRYYTPLDGEHFEARAATGSSYAELNTFKMPLKVIAVVVQHLRFCRRQLPKH